MNPFVLLALVGGSAYALPRLFGSRREARRKRRKERAFPICGAYWSYGQAIVPYETNTGWAFTIYDGSGRKDADTELANRGVRYPTKNEAVIAGVGFAKNNVIAQQVAGVPSSFLEPGMFGEPKGPWIRVYTPHGKAAQLPPEVDDAFCTNPTTNKYWVDDTCEVVVEGAGFEPYSQGASYIVEEPAANIDEALAIEGNTLYGYLSTFGNDFELGNALSLIAEEMGCGPGEDGFLTATQELYLHELERRTRQWWIENDFAIPFNT